MRVLIAGHQEGKTTKLMAWVHAGIAVDQYPGWSRIAVVVNRQRHDQLKSEYWRLIEDFDHRIYTMDDIRDGFFPSGETLYRVDDLDAFLPVLFPNMCLDGFTITAKAWDADDSAYRYWPGGKKVD